MADVRHELTICPECDGCGWYSDHDPSDPHIDGFCTNCPVQVQCEKCEATGLVYKVDLENEKQERQLNNKFIDEMPF